MTRLIAEVVLPDPAAAFGPLAFTAAMGLLAFANTLRSVGARH